MYPLRKYRRLKWARAFRLLEKHNREQSRKLKALGRNMRNARKRL